MDNNPLLIDWEATRKLNPTYDLINVCLDWSGITTDNFNQALFLKMIHAYISAGAQIDTSILSAAFYGTFGWLNWLICNIERACTSQEPDQIALSIEQVNQTLKTILKLKNIIPDLIPITLAKIESTLN